MANDETLAALERAVAVLHAYAAQWPEPGPERADAALIRALIERERAGGWNDIASNPPPMDGTKIDLWVWDERRADCYWQGSLKRGKWWAPNQDYDGMDGVLCGRDEPTHWRPLPEPPIASGAHLAGPRVLSVNVVQREGEYTGPGDYPERWVGE